MEPKKPWQLRRARLGRARHDLAQSLPFVLWPVGNQPLLAHWMDEAVRRGVEEVEIFVADRPAEVRLWLEGGAYWSRPVKVIPIGREADAPADAERVSTACQTRSRSARSQPARSAAAPLVFDLQKIWLALRTARGRARSTPCMPAAAGSGRSATVDPTAQLVPPFWIGAGAKVGDALPHRPERVHRRERAMIDEDAEIEKAFVGANTYVGKYTRISHGDRLRQGARGHRARRARGNVRAIYPRVCRGGTARVRVSASGWRRWLAAFSSRPWRPCLTAADGRSGASKPATARRSTCAPAGAARCGCGAGRGCGTSPRDGCAGSARCRAEACHGADAGGTCRAACARAGRDVFARGRARLPAPEDPEEWIHASYQAQAVDPKAARTVLKNLWKIAWSRQSRHHRADVKYSEYAECEIGAELESVRAAVERLRHYCAQQRPERAALAELELAIVEGLNNAVEHGCAGDRGCARAASLELDGRESRGAHHRPGGFVPDAERRACAARGSARGGRPRRLF